MEVDKEDDQVLSMHSTSSDDLVAPSQEASSPITFKVKKEDAETPSIKVNGRFLPESDSSTKNQLWRGTPLGKLSRNTDKDVYPPVAVDSHHAVLFKLPVKCGEVSKPWPEKSVDLWDKNHVRMPHSASSLYPVTPNTIKSLLLQLICQTEVRKRWQLVEQSLNSTISTSDQLQAAILYYNSEYGDRWHFQTLHSFLSESIEERETEYFFMQVLPKVIKLALSLPRLLTQGIPLLKRHCTHSISFTQHQISCLLANAFLCTFPRGNTSEYSSYPEINFNRLFNGDTAIARGRLSPLHEKLKCIINYFRIVTNKVPEGVVTYSRHYVSPDELPKWSEEQARLPDLYVSSEGTIEDQGTDMLEIDFANKFIGGGVLGSGCVQEEIRFVICPELILARLFTEVMDDTEALIITGCERFSSYQGYADSFKWMGDYQDNTPRDSFGRRRCTVVAIDAIYCDDINTQYTAANINRELNKAYTGFSWGAGQDRASVATGNWGCGAFRGDISLKFLVQLMAAACAGRGIAYFTFGNKELCHRLADMHEFLTKRQVCVGDLWNLINSYNPAFHRYSLYDHIYKTVSLML